MCLFGYIFAVHHPTWMLSKTNGVVEKAHTAWSSAGNAAQMSWMKMEKWTTVCLKVGTSVTAGMANQSKKSFKIEAHLGVQVRVCVHVHLQGISSFISNQSGRSELTQACMTTALIQSYSLAWKTIISMKSPLLNSRLVIPVFSALRLNLCFHPRKKKNMNKEKRGCQLVRFA